MGYLIFLCEQNADRLKHRAIHAFGSGDIPNMFLRKISYWR